MPDEVNTFAVRLPTTEQVERTTSARALPHPASRACTGLIDVAARAGPRLAASTDRSEPTTTQMITHKNRNVVERSSPHDAGRGSRVQRRP